MKITIDLELLKEQITQCDIKANNASSEEEQALFDGLADFLSAICYDVEHYRIAEIIEAGEE